MVSIVTNYLKDDNRFGKEHATVVHVWHFHIELFSAPAAQMLCEMDITGGKHPLRDLSRRVFAFETNPPNSRYMGMMLCQGKPQSACNQIF